MTRSQDDRMKRWWDDRGPVSTCHPVISSSCHPVILSSIHPVTCRPLLLVNPLSIIFRGEETANLSRRTSMRQWFRNLVVAIKTVAQGMWITLWYFLQTYK